MEIPDWLQSTLKWPVLILFAFTSVWLVFEGGLPTSMGGPCISTDPDATLQPGFLQKCQNQYDGSVFALLVIFGVTTALGRATVALSDKLPPLLGMLLGGLLLNNVPGLKDLVGLNVNATMSSHIRNVALALILIRAGLGLDLSALMQMKWVIVRLAFLPCAAEALAVGLFAYLLLGFDWKWGVMLGWLFSAVSPAVVVPSLLSLTEKGFGVSTGIVPTAIAAAALGDVMSIVCFSIFMGFAVSTNEFSAAGFLDIPIQLVAGLVVGAVLAGVVVVATRPKSDGETPGNDTVRMAAVTGAGVTCMFLFKKIDFGGCAALGVLVLAIGAGKGWGAAAAKRVAAPLTWYWNSVAQPVLFGLVGCQVDFLVLRPDTVGFGILILVVGLVARIGTGYGSMAGRGLKPQEMFFASLSQLPKATVQAALCAQPLEKLGELCRASLSHPGWSGNTDCSTSFQGGESTLAETWDAWGNQVLQLAVLTIVCTAPVGASIIVATGPKMLTQDAANVINTANPTTVPEVDEPDPDVIERVLSFHPNTFTELQTTHSRTNVAPAGES